MAMAVTTFVPMLSFENQFHLQRVGQLELACQQVDGTRRLRHGVDVEFDGHGGCGVGGWRCNVFD